MRNFVPSDGQKYELILLLAKNTWFFIGIGKSAVQFEAFSECRSSLSSEYPITRDEAGHPILRQEYSEEVRDTIGTFGGLSVPSTLG